MDSAQQKKNGQGDEQAVSIYNNQELCMTIQYQLSDVTCDHVILVSFWKLIFKL